MGLRVHRAISWIGRAEAAGDDDARFLFFRIGFNAAYADEEEVQNAAAPERDAFKEFFQKVVALDAGQRIYDAIWDNFSGPIRVLLHNKYLLTPAYSRAKWARIPERSGQRFRWQTDHDGAGPSTIRRRAGVRDCGSPLSPTSSRAWIHDTAPGVDPTMRSFA